MFGFITLFLILSLTLSGAAGAGKVLRFNYGCRSHVSFPTFYDRNIFSGEFSFCSWVKGQGVILYVVEAGILVQFRPWINTRVQLFKAEMNLARDQSDPRGRKTPDDVWFHYCGTFDNRNNYRAYLNGVLQGRPQYTIPPNYFGNNFVSIGHGFQGDLLDFNFYSKALTQEEIAAMSAGDTDNYPCSAKVGSGYLDEFKSKKWEDIMKLPIIGDQRSISHVDAPVGCPASDDDSEDDSDDDSEDDSDRDDSEDDNEINKINAALEEAKKELEEAKKEELEEAKKELLEAKKELENVEECDVTDELQKGVLYSPNFYNKKFTRKLQKKLIQTWRKKSKKLLGKTLTDEAIKKFKD